MEALYQLSYSPVFGALVSLARPLMITPGFQALSSGPVLRPCPQALSSGPVLRLESEGHQGYVIR